MLESPPGWLLFLLYPAFVAILIVVWLLTRGSTTELSLKGFGVELVLKENRLKTIAVIQAEQETETIVKVQPK